MKGSAPPKILVFTFTRAEYGLIRCVLGKLVGHFSVALYVGGAHLSPFWGESVRDIRKDGLPVAGEVDFLFSTVSEATLCRSLGVGIGEMAHVFEKERPDFLLVTGDRWEMMIPVCAAVLFKVPIVHYYAGEVLPGKNEMTIDQQIRFSITSASHFCWVTTREYAEVVSRTGLEDWRIFVLGSSGVESLLSAPVHSVEELRRELGVDFSVPTVIATYHPPTLGDPSAVRWQIENLIEALDRIPDLHTVFTMPNLEVGSREVFDAIEQYVKRSSRAHLVRSFGAFYASALRHSKAVVGNSSSGILEALSFGLPTVNVGERQLGRIHPPSVERTGYESTEIQRAIERAVFDEDYRAWVRDLRNPYGDGRASEYALDALQQIASMDRTRVMGKVLDFEVKRSGWHVYF